MFCRNCGAKLVDGAVFCGECGEKVPGAAINNNEAAAPAETGDVKVESGKTVRIVCVSCGKATDFTSNGQSPVCTCPKCNTDNSINEGYLLIYRKGSPLGIAVGFGIYIDGKPSGLVANQQTVRIAVPYGTHILHVASGMNRKCNDTQFVLSEADDTFACKVSMRPGALTNSFVIEPCDEADIPNA